MNFFLPPAGVLTKCCLQFIFISFIFFKTSFAADPQSCFTENKGQIVDQFAHQRSDIKFVYVQGSFKLFLKSNGFSYELVNQPALAAIDEATGFEDESFEKDANDGVSKLSVSRIDITLKNCNPHPVIEARDTAPFYQNYYNHLTGAQGITGVKSFRQIVYNEVYPHIDLVFTITSDKKKPEYSFILHPGSDPGKIQMSYAGAGNKFFDSENGFTMKVKEGSLYESRPVGFYEHEEQNGVLLNFQLKNNTLSLAPF
ncbi:MAG TPA: hypothetical protein PLD84_15540, partial [Chitinophagales bacterium]|nr:hypothetical protein [Chitinophagales bacterium]